jgi:malate/lactate dehydrogenase
MKLGVIGGSGQIGSTAAFLAGVKGLVSEIKLVDINRNLLKSHVLDMNQALIAESNTRVVLAEYADLVDCDVLLLSAALPERSVSSRNDYLKGNVEIVKDVCASIKKYCREKIFITATNPIDVCNYKAYSFLQWDRKKFIGFCSNDTLRLKWAIANLLKVDFDRVDALCIGEHGEGQIPLFDRILVDGEQKILSPEQIAGVKELIGSWFADYQKLQSGRSPGWTSAVGLAAILRALARGSEKPLPCSAIPDGEYNERGLSIGLPCRLGKNGIEEILRLELRDQDEKKFREAADKIRALIEMADKP